jgi:hypothetical protein
MRAAKRRKAKKVAQRRYEEERMAALEMEAAAAAGASKSDDVLDAEHKSAIQVTFGYFLCTNSIPAKRLVSVCVVLNLFPVRKQC